ncbi:hypothetical protein BgiMline_022315 [Biomphalaria glabrata]|uniref:Uncharacterized protein n=1 Tax=Biomphalaria glabrata TaxID=6526 RepID=A0A2C9LUT4_BIOGL|nr:CAunnamed protein product [Biomphalaria glabrata]
MAYLISNRTLVKVICLLITSLCAWIMYFMYMTRRAEDAFFESRSKFNDYVREIMFESDLSIKADFPSNRTDQKTVAVNPLVSNQQHDKERTFLTPTVTSSLALLTVTLKQFQSSDDENLAAINSPAKADSQQNNTEPGYLVYLCDSTLFCGGWGDRQRGITSLYFVSKILGRQFKIVMSTPCDLSNFYVPNRVDWQIDTTLKELKSTEINSMNNDRFFQNLKSGDFNQKFPYKVVFVRTNSDFYDRVMRFSSYSPRIKHWKVLLDARDRFRWAWNDLMKPSLILLKDIEHIVGSSFLIKKGLINKPIETRQQIRSLYDIDNSTLICGHVRIGKNPTIPMDEDLYNFKMTDLPTLHRFMLAKSRVSLDSYFFVATDYDYVRKESLLFFGDRLIDYGGQIMHIDRQRNGQSVCSGLEVALIDQLLLSLCDVLVISKSGFSRYASYLNNSTANIYILENGQITQNVNKNLRPKSI